MTGTSVAADAVRTVDWLSAAGISYVVPVYQRQYRWGTDNCARLLEDVRAVAGSAEGRTHFVGSILHTDSWDGAVTQRMLVDGQQRVTTLMLLVAAIRDILGDGDRELSGELDRMLLHPAVEGRTRLTLRHEGARELDGVVFDRVAPPGAGEGESRVRENYEFFREEIHADAEEVWRGVRRLEHVAIALGEHASPQQVFESLNSTGTPLRDHELVHNYVLMGLTHAQQTDIEDRFWVPIERNTGEAIDSFLRDYLILRTGRDSELGGERGVYEVFRTEFRSPGYESLVEDAAQWKSYSEVYRVLLDPSREPDRGIRKQLYYVNTFGTAMYPLLLGVYRDYRDGEIGRDALLELLEQLQSLYLRRMVVGASRDHLAAQLCRKRRQYGYPIRSIVRGTPSDERMRVALAYRPLPHAGYVLRRMQRQGRVRGLEIEHIFPQYPGEVWSGDGVRSWADFDEWERAKYREVLQTIGNLTLLEQPLNAAAGNKPFPKKKEFYERSAVAATRELTATPVWDLQAIAERTERLTDAFLDIWRRPNMTEDGDADFLVPILDVPRRAGYYKGWKTEFEYVRFRDEVWEVRDAKSLYRRVFMRLWETRRAEVLAYCAPRRWTIDEKKDDSPHWVPLQPSHYLYTGLFPQYCLAQVQGVLDELDMADEVLVKFTPEDE